MDINALFPSNYLKAADLQGQARRVTIASCAPEQLWQGEIKPALSFREVPKKLILNKTNGMLIAASYGTETSAWAGRELELFPDTVMFQGQVVPAIRVRVPIGAAVPFAAGAVFQAAAPPPPPPPAAPMADAQPMPFAAAPPAATQAPPVGQVQPVQAPQPEQAALPLDTPISW